MLAAFAFNSIAAKEVSTDVFGQFSLILSVVTVAVMVCNFGFYSSMPVVLAEKSNESLKYKLIASCFLIAVFCGIMVLGILIFFGDIIDESFAVHISYIFLSCWFFLIFAPFKQILLQIGKGLKHTRVLVLVRIGIPIAMLAGLVCMRELFPITLLGLNFLQFGSITSIVLLSIFMLKPDFTDVVKPLKIVCKKNCEYGTRVYVSHIFAFSWPEIIVFLIPSYGSLSDLAHYRVSLLLVSPLIVISQNIATYFFRSFASNQKISFTVISFNLVMVCAQLAIYYSIIGKVLLAFFGDDYLPSLSLIYIMAIGAAFTSLCQLPSSYMNAHSHGNSILVSSILMCIIAIVTAFLLIPKYGPMGAAYAYLFSNICYFISIHCFYLIYKKV